MVLLVYVLGPVGGVENGGADAVFVPVFGELAFAREPCAVHMAASAEFVAVEDVREPIGRQADVVNVGPVGMVDHAGPVPGRPWFVWGSLDVR